MPCKPTARHGACAHQRAVELFHLRVQRVAARHLARQLLRQARVDGCMWGVAAVVCCAQTQGSRAAVSGVSAHAAVLRRLQHSMARPRQPARQLRCGCAHPPGWRPLRPSQRARWTAGCAARLPLPPGPPAAVPAQPHVGTTGGGEREASWDAQHVLVERATSVSQAGRVHNPHLLLYGCGRLLQLRLQLLNLWQQHAPTAAGTTRWCWCLLRACRRTQSRVCRVCCSGRMRLLFCGAHEATCGVSLSPVRRARS
jgi:hypothetical protein